MYTYFEENLPNDPETVLWNAVRAVVDYEDTSDAEDSLFAMDDADFTRTLGEREPRRPTKRSRRQ
jgi:hypothetical protein